MRCCSRAWWHRSRHHLSLWPAQNETNFADWFNLQYAATPAMWDESMQGTEPACLPSVIRVNRMSKLKSHTGSRWTEYSHWKSLLICILICWEQSYLGARPDDAGTMLSMDGPLTDDPTELLLLLYTPKRRQTLQRHINLYCQYLKSCYYILFFTMIKAVSRRSTVWNGGWNSWNGAAVVQMSKLD